jgi:osmotically-inducible protein OsmY
MTFLHVRGIPGVSSLSVDIDGNHVILSGTMPSLQAKRWCIECCRRVAGVMSVTDELEIEAAP